MLRRIELGTTPTEGRELTNCAILPIGYFEVTCFQPKSIAEIYDVRR